MGISCFNHKTSTKQFWSEKPFSDFFLRGGDEVSDLQPFTNDFNRATYKLSFIKLFAHLSYIYISYVHKPVSMKSTVVLYLSLPRTLFLIFLNSETVPLKFFSAKYLTLYFQICSIGNTVRNRNILYNLYINCTKLNPISIVRLNTVDWRQEPTKEI